MAPWFVLLVACPAEWLGIPVPAEGIDAIAMDDLVRDVARLSGGEAAAATPSGEAARRAFLAERWSQMGLSPAADGRCGRRDGTGPDVVAVVAEPGAPGDPVGQAPTAVVISVAKAFHGRPPDARGAWFCVGEPPDAGPIVRVTAEEARAAARDGDLDYRVLVDLARAKVPVVEAALTAPIAEDGGVR